MIHLENVSLFYENFQALKSITATIPSASITGLAGINGAGKSSLIKSMLGLLPEFDGEITIAGHHVKNERQWIKRHCNYAPEETELFDYLSGFEFLQFVAILHQVKDVSKAIEQMADLFEMHDFLPFLIDEYSHGMRQKMLLSAALINQPDFLFIDEAINGLDTLSLFRFKDYLFDLKRRGTTIVIASHVLPILSDWCDQIMIIHQGEMLKILSKEEIQSDGRSLENIFIELISRH